MLDKEIDQIGLPDIHALMTNSVPEGKSVEYKRQLPGGSDDESRKFLRVVCSFANTNGGDLIYGVDAPDGVPTAIPGLAAFNEDEWRLKLENKIRDLIEPRVSNIHFKKLDIDPQTSVWMIRVGKSWNSPHRLKSDGFFYGRNSSGCYPLDVGEIRQSFVGSEQVLDRIRNFRADRLIQIESNNTPVQLESGWRFVFHLVPMSAFSSAEQRITLTDVQQSNLNPLIWQGATGFINLEGYLRQGVRNNRTSSYVQLYRNGIVECVACLSEIDNEKQIPAVALETSLIQSLRSYLRLLEECRLEGPYFVFLAFLGVRDYYLYSERIRTLLRERKLRDRDNIILNNISIENAKGNPQDVLKPLFDMWWNAFGYERCFDYDEAGNWIGRST